MDEYERGFKGMHSLACDVPLGSHPAMYNIADKYAKLGKGGPNPFIDPQGYKTEVAIEEGAFRGLLEQQQKARRGEEVTPRGSISEPAPGSGISTPIQFRRPAHALSPWPALPTRAEAPWRPV